MKSERERLLERLRGVKALAEKGSDGERDNAAALLAALMQKHGITEADLENAQISTHWIRYKTIYERKLLFQRAMKLNWNKVCNIISEEIEDILGLHIQCKINRVEDSFWSVTFIGYRLPLSKLCQIVHITQPTPEDWEDAMPDDGGVDVNGIGMALCEKLLARQLKFTWEHHLITEDSLWLVGVAAAQCHSEFDGKRPERIEIYWQDLTQAKQSEILQVLGENGNWDVFPIAAIDVPAEDETDL